MGLGVSKQAMIIALIYLLIFTIGLGYKIWTNPEILEPDTEEVSYEETTN